MIALQEEALRKEIQKRWFIPIDRSSEILRSGFYSGAVWSFANPLVDIAAAAHSHSASRVGIEREEQSVIWRAGFELGALWARRFEGFEDSAIHALEEASQ